MKKKLTLLLGLILILVISGYIYTVTSTLGWITFTNTRYHYQFDHPKEVRMDTERVLGSDPFPVEFSVFVSIPKKTKLFDVYVEYGDGTSQVLSEYVKTVWEKNKSPKTGSLKEIKVDGKPAYSFTTTSGFASTHGEYSLNEDQVYNYVFIKNDEGYIVTLHYPIYSKVYPELMPISKQIFNSFKFK